MLIVIPRLGAVKYTVNTCSACSFFVRVLPVGHLELRNGWFPNYASP